MLLPLLLLVLVALGAFFLLNKSKTGVTPQTSTTTTQPTLAPTAQTGATEDTFFGMIKSGQSLECTWQSKDQTSNMEPGKVWFGGGMARSMFKTKAGATGDAVEANAIMRDGKVYTWVQLAGIAPMGFMMDQQQVTAMGKNLTPQEVQQAQQYQQKVNFSCKPWVVDATQFSLPSNVQFRSQ